MRAIAFLFFLLLVSMAGCMKKVENPADAIYTNGEIITMDGDSPTYPEAVATRKGKIVFVGPRLEAFKMKGDSTVIIDLLGKTLLPGFIDAHGHLSNAGFQASTANLLAPPDGSAVDIGSIIELVKDWQSRNHSFVDKVGWVIGFGYDDAQLAERRHPVASDLDRISKDLPVLVIHQSGHLGAVNTKALELLGYKNGVSDPKGGVIRRKQGTWEPNGVLEEMALFIPVFGILARMDDSLNRSMIHAGIREYVKYGFTTAQEGRASHQTCETYKKMAQANQLPIDVVAYPDIQQEMEYMKASKNQFNYNYNFRIAGVKLSLDGSPQGKTAWLTQPYLVPPEGKDKNYRGYPAIPDEKNVTAYVDSAFANGWQILAHCNGDAAADQYIRAIRKASNRYGNDNRRSVMIHAQTVRDDQLDSMQVLQIIPSFFSMHTFYWGDWHRDETLGRERAYRISPAVSAYNRGIVFTEHHDAPVTRPDAIRILWCAVNRISRSGDIIGPDQRITPFIALKSITAWAAYQYFEENLKGTLSEGKLADFVILSANPLKVDPINIDGISIMETIKEGKTVYKKE